MGIIERKEREKEQLRKQILLTAKEIIDREGHEQLSLRKIAAAIEYSPTTLYLYFKDKDEILFELSEMGFSKMAKLMAPAFKESDPIKALHKKALAYVDFAMKHPDWYDIMFELENPMNHLQRCKEDWCKGQQLFEAMIQLCARFLEAKKNTHTDPLILALQLWSTVHGLVSLMQAKRLQIIEHIPEKKLIAQTIDTTIDLLTRCK